MQKLSAIRSTVPRDRGVTTRIAGVSMESTVRWAMWMVGSMLVAMTLVIVFPQLVLWLPGLLGY